VQIQDLFIALHASFVNVKLAPTTFTPSLDCKDALSPGVADFFAQLVLKAILLVQIWTEECQ
jgi:hypothetical protein